MTWLTTNWPVTLALFWAIYNEVLAAIPTVKSNSFGQLIFNILTAVTTKPPTT